MDFLKTLLAYIALLTTLGVQEGPAPETVPTPTPLPPHITATPEPHQTAAPTATPAPTSAPTPEATANRRYTQLEFGDKNANVRKLQNALIELGYMPAGSADSSYGYQTYNAVKAFQKRNGLSVDGVAGPLTLTCLYENPHVLGATEEATPVPTATPTPSLPPLPTANSSSVGSKPQQEQTQEQPAATQAAAVQTALPPQNALTLLDGAYIINGVNGATLYRETLVDGAPALVRPALWLNASGTPVVALAELVDSMEGWSLMGSSADGIYALNACGYTISIHLKEEGLSILVDGEAVIVPADEVFLQDDTLYVTDLFLNIALKAQTVFDTDEKSLVVFFKDKSVANAQD